MAMCKIVHIDFRHIEKIALQNGVVVQAWLEIKLRFFNGIWKYTLNK